MHEYILNVKKEDGYLQHHAATSFHAPPYFRLISEPTLKTDGIIDRVIRDQKEVLETYPVDRTASIFLE